jgi:hypothetical protein
MFVVSGFMVSKAGQQKIADLSNVVVHKDVEPKIAVDRSKLRVIDPAEGNRIDYYMDLINDLFVKAELNGVHTARRMKTAPADDPELFSALPRFPLKLRSAAPRVLPLETFEASGTDSVGFNDLNGA